MNRGYCCFFLYIYIAYYLKNSIQYLLMVAGDWGTVKQRAADASFYADVSAGTAVAEKVLCAQRHLPLPGRSVS